MTGLASEQFRSAIQVIDRPVVREQGNRNDTLEKRH